MRQSKETFRADGKHSLFNLRPCLLIKMKKKEEEPKKKKHISIERFKRVRYATVMSITMGSFKIRLIHKDLGPLTVTLSLCPLRFSLDRAG